MTTRIRKAVFPAAGLGTRILPATKAMPKEMLPLVDRPLIQYGVEECLGSGIDRIIIVTGRGKGAIEDHFDISPELEAHLRAKGKPNLARALRAVSDRITVSYTRQSEPLGLGHAVLMARDLVGDEPFAVVLPDDIMDSQPPALKQMIDVFDRVDGPVLLVERVPREEISRYGIIDAEPLGPGVYRVRDLVEKPAADQAPSDLGIVGRYLLTPDVFPSLESTAKDRSGEIQLTDGLRALLRHRPVYACEVTGVRHDAGSRLGFLKAQLYFAMKQPDLAGPLREYLKPFVS